MLELLEFFTFVWLGLWTLYAARQLVNRNYNPTYILLIVFFVFFGLPLGEDLFIGKPILTLYRGFDQAINDDSVSALYCWYMATIPLLWWYVGIRNVKTQTFDYKTIIGLRPFFWITLFAPLIAVVFAPDTDLYLKYGWVADAGIRTVEGLEYQDLVAILAVSSLVAAIGLLASTKKIRIPLVLFLGFIVFIDIWLNGKRYIVAFFLLLITYVVFLRTRMKRSTLIIGLMFAALVLLTFSLFYQDTIRNITSDSERFYTNFRIDYGRDLVTKLTLHAELYPEEFQILPARGYSVLFNLATYVPRSLWPEKPYPYAIYLTSAVFNIFPARPLGWGLTTSWLEEAIANFSWLGLLIGPMVPVLICRWSNASKNSMTTILGALVAVLFIVVQLSAFTPLFLVWLAIMLIARIQARKTPPPQYSPLISPKQPSTERL
jgi:hypothetical protein